MTLRRPLRLCDVQRLAAASGGTLDPAIAWRAGFVHRSATTPTGEATVLMHPFATKDGRTLRAAPHLALSGAAAATLAVAIALAARAGGSAARLATRRADGRGMLDALARRSGGREALRDAMERFLDDLLREAEPWLPRAQQVVAALPPDAALNRAQRDAGVALRATNGAPAAPLLAAAEQALPPDAGAAAPSPGKPAGNGADGAPQPGAQAPSDPNAPDCGGHPGRGGDADPPPQPGRGRANLPPNAPSAPAGEGEGRGRGGRRPDAPNAPDADGDADPPPQPGRGRGKRRPDAPATPDAPDADGRGRGRGKRRPDAPATPDAPDADGDASPDVPDAPDADGDAPDAPDADAPETPARRRRRERRQRAALRVRDGAPSNPAGRAFGRAFGRLPRSADPAVVARLRRILATLVADGGEGEDGPRLHVGEATVRVLTHRSPYPARRQERGRPAILVIADVSGSCAAFAEPACAVARAAAALGVPGADVAVITVFTPREGEPPGGFALGDATVNGRVVPGPWQTPEGRGRVRAHDDLLADLARAGAGGIGVIIALGDVDEAMNYAALAARAHVRRFIWLDNYGARAGGPRDAPPPRAQDALGGFAAAARRITTHLVGCGDVDAMLAGLARALRRG